MVDFAGGGGVEQPGTGTHLPEDGPVLGDLSANLFDDQSSGVAVREHGSNHREAGIDSLVEHSHRLVQVGQSPQLKPTRLHDYTSISSGR